MNYRKITSQLSSILLIEAAFLVLPVLVALIYKESLRIFVSFGITIAALIIASLLMRIKKPLNDNFYAKDGYMLVALSWTVVSAFGALPFVISGAIPNYIDAFFETVSGFTTTGSTILTDIESLPKALLFWRSFTHFIGGMGILVFVLAILPKTDGSAMHIMRAEVPGPTVGKLVSRLSATSRILYAIYTGMTVVLALLLFIGKMPLFDSICNAFATAGTGGFCVLNSSIGGYNSHYAEIVISFFMMFYGVNFNLYYLVLRGQGRRAVKDEELRWYVGIIAVATLILTLELTVTKYPFADSLRLAFFQVSSIVSTTGFGTADFDLWPTLSKIILFLLMFIGGCAGSTGGGIKVQRVAVLCKNSKRILKKALNPRAFEGVKMNGRSLDEETVRGIVGYAGLCMIILFLSVFVIAIDGHKMLPTISSVVTCFNNVGPAFEEIGPTGNFSAFSPLSKIVLSFDMLCGRLEIIPMFVLFSKYIIPRRYS